MGCDLTQHTISTLGLGELGLGSQRTSQPVTRQAASTVLALTVDDSDRGSSRSRITSRWRRMASFISDNRKRFETETRPYVIANDEPESLVETVIALRPE